MGAFHFEALLAAVCFSGYSKTPQRRGKKRNNAPEPDLSLTICFQCASTTGVSVTDRAMVLRNSTDPLLLIPLHAQVLTAQHTVG